MANNAESEPEAHADELDDLGLDLDWLEEFADFCETQPASDGTLADAERIFEEWRKGKQAAGRGAACAPKRETVILTPVEGKENDKNPNLGRPVLPSLDAEFLRIFRDLVREREEVSPIAPYSKVYIERTSPFSIPPITHVPYLRPIKSGDGTFEFKLCKTRLRQWRDVTDEVRLQFALEAMALTGGPFFGFALRLDRKVQAKAYAAPSALAFLHERIRNSLKAAFGRTIEFVLVLEELLLGAGEEQRHDIHLHGLIQIADAEKKVARPALIKAAGAWAKGAGHQLVFQRSPDCDWPSYHSKTFRLHRRRALYERYGSAASNRLAQNRKDGHTKIMTATFAGQALSMTGASNKAAEAIYNAVTGRG